MINRACMMHSENNSYIA